MWFQVAAQEGRLLFMTTNHIERLSSALIRPGRVDVRCFLGPATRAQAKQMFISFYRDLPMQLALQGSAGEEQPDLSSSASQAQQGVGARVSTGVDGSTDLQQPPLSDKTAAGGKQRQTRQAGRSPSLIRVASAKEAADREAALSQLAAEFEAKLPKAPAFSTASLQAFLMSHRLAPVQAVSKVQGWLEEQQSADNEEMT